MSEGKKGEISTHRLPPQPAQPRHHTTKQPRPIVRFGALPELIEKNEGAARRVAEDEGHLLEVD